MDFDDGLSAFIAVVMSAAGADYLTARYIVHALHDAGYLDIRPSLTGLDIEQNF